jgi:DNA polymerase-1
MGTVIIDGSNLFMIHVSANPAVGQDGIPIGGMKGFLSSLTWIVRATAASRVVIFFDGKGGSTKKRQAFKDYKAGRRPPTVVGRFYDFSDKEQCERNRDYQLSCLLKALENLPVDAIVCTDFEGDDAVAYACNSRGAFDLGDCTIVSCDKDFYQLISDEVKIYNPMSKKFISEQDVVNEFGIHPENWLFYRSVTGDKSDNIDGIKSFGPKTMLKLFPKIAEKGAKILPEDIDDLFEVSKEIEDKTVQSRIKMLHENKAKIERNWSLMSLSDPMMSNRAKDFLTSRLNTFEPHFKRIELFKCFSDIGVDLNFYNFDVFDKLMASARRNKQT